MSYLKITIPEDQITQFCQKNYITTMSLFGSVLTEQFNTSSDAYFDIDHDIIWKTIQIALPDLIPQIEKAITILNR